MKLSKLVGERLKDVPSGASLKSHIYLLRAGYIKQVSSGIFSLMPPAERVSQKIQKIIREEMDAIGGQEVLFPVVMPRELWEMSGRYDSIQEELLRFKDRTGHDMLLGMTHEEAAVHMVMNTVKSHEQLPCMIYQIQTKYRDEARPRGGLIRVREFTMKDAYSFHTSQEDLDVYYKKAFDAYNRIYKRIGLKNFISVRSDGGIMGGKVADEFMLVTEAGEDRLVLCDHCGYKANMEVAEGNRQIVETDEENIEEVFTGNAKTIDEVCHFLEIDASKTVKAVCYETEQGALIVAFLRGDYDINEKKLAKLVKSEIKIADTDKFNLVAGNIGPINLVLPENSYVFYDLSIKDLKNFVTGANKKDYHLKNVSAPRDLENAEYIDIALVKEGDTCAVCGEKLRLTRGIEIGNIFQLGTKYTKSMGMKVSMPDGSVIEPIMGCYGIGIGRAIASVIEEKGDDKGIVWPMTIAPWQVHFCPLRLDDENVEVISNELYKKMLDAGIEVIFDDRHVSAGVKLTDSELMGMPIRVIVSPKTISSGTAEITLRESGETYNVSFANLITELLELIEDLKEEIEK